MKKKIIIGIIVSLVIGCGVGVGATYLAQHKKLNIQTNNIMAYNWLENSGEASALEYQAYNNATNVIKEAVKKPSQKQKAVILDIDETVVSNGGYFAWQIKEGKGYSKEDYTKWINQNKATAVDGAIEFTQEAKKLGVEVFYVTNRYEDVDMDGTIANLKKLGFPNADTEHILLKGKSGSKETRWNNIKAKYDVVLQIGDNLCDLSNKFEHKSNEQEKELVSASSEDFGTKYIVIPNPIYGNFEGAMYGYNYGASDEQKLEAQYKLIDSSATTINTK